MKKNYFRITATVMAATLALSAGGCGKKEDKASSAANKDVTEANSEVSVAASEDEVAPETVEDSSAEADEEIEETTEETVEETAEETDAEDDAEEADEMVVDNDLASEQAEEVQLTDVQWNSISMLNYLIVLTQEINTSKNSRLYLENAYSSLLNNTYPNSVDTRTQVEMEDLLDILHDFRMLDVKRERLQYIYEQNCAQAIRSAIPNPLGLLSAVSSMNLAKIATSVVYMAVDSYTSYTAYTRETDLEYLQDGWALDDEEADTLHESSMATFSYLMDMVREYQLPGDLTLNENAVNDFVKWDRNSNVIQRIQFLEANKSTYQAYGEYWLSLARSYYENEQYEDCLKAIDKYESIQVRIFRKDYKFAQALPYAIAATEAVLDGDEYVERINRYSEAIRKNCDQSEWKLLYLAAQCYVSLYGKTSDKEYLQEAYDIILNNVNDLVNTQKEKNKEYLSAIDTESYPDGATEEKKREIDSYNKQLEVTRETELPPIHEPLLVNCNLLYALAEELDIDDAEKTRIDMMLHEDGDQLFLVKSVDDLYWLNPPEEDDEEDEDIRANMKEATFSLPAKYVTDDAVITATISREDEEDVVIEDWVIDSVMRDEEDDIDSFMAKYYSEEADDYSYKTGDVITVEVLPKDGCDIEPLTFEFEAKKYRKTPEFWEFQVSISQI